MSPRSARVRRSRRRSLWTATGSFRVGARLRLGAGRASRGRNRPGAGTGSLRSLNIGSLRSARDPGLRPGTSKFSQESRM
eukprot:1808655-Prymnesium_polylepis.1